ncbi:MAG: hypothetical protein N4A53_03080 [Pelagimonas sp.]|nr:hypothetical protein [Pelagimonas sp.]
MPKLRRQGKEITFDFGGATLVHCNRSLLKPLPIEPVATCSVALPETDKRILYRIGSAFQGAAKDAGLLGVHFLLYWHNPLLGFCVGCEDAVFGLCVGHDGAFNQSSKPFLFHHLDEA